ncbi:hypothetical protein M758_12G063700 [Ceratodon purpureus]|nr:hypothetical protein M758_12G063700 [Ceratodon purpureus]
MAALQWHSQDMLMPSSIVSSATPHALPLGPTPPPPPPPPPPHKLSPPPLPLLSHHHLHHPHLRLHLHLHHHRITATALLTRVPTSLQHLHPGVCEYLGKL